jgi:hypothetical protein
MYPISALASDLESVLVLNLDRIDLKDSLAPGKGPSVVTGFILESLLDKLLYSNALKMVEGTLFQFLSLIRVKLQDLAGGARLGSHGEAFDKANCQEEEEYPHGGVKRVP